MNNSVSLEASQIVAEAEYNPFFFLSTTVGRTELFSCPFLARATKREAGEVLCKVGGAGDRFGEIHLHVMSNCTALLVKM